MRLVKLDLTQYLLRLRHCQVVKHLQCSVTRFQRSLPIARKFVSLRRALLTFSR